MHNPRSPLVLYHRGIPGVHWGKLKCRATAFQTFSRMLEVSINLGATERGPNDTLCCITAALCKAAYNNNDPNALAQAFPLMNEAEIQDVKDFVKRFGCKFLTI